MDFLIYDTELDLWLAKGSRWTTKYDEAAFFADFWTANEHRQSLDLRKCTTKIVQAF